MKNDGLKGLLDVVGGILAFLVVIVLLAEAVLSQNWFKAPEVLLKAITVVKNYGVIVLAGVAGLEFIQGKSLVIKLIFLVALAGVIIFQFFPGTWNNLMADAKDAVAKV